MKKIILVAACLVVTCWQVIAQATPPGDTKLSDPVMSQRLQGDLGTRHAQLRTQPVDWYSNGEGYYGTYTIGQDDYVARYDKQGVYVETMKKGDWNGADVPASLKSAFAKSEYRDQQVTNYYHVSDPGSKGYYLEVEDKSGKSSRVWVDEYGVFSSKPSRSGARMN